MTVSPGPDTRRRLAEFMEERRLDLGLRWQDVADAAFNAGFKVSLKTLHSVRAGTADIRPMTQRGIDAGLQWERGSVRAILSGGGPTPAESGDEPTLPGVLPAAAPVTSAATDPLTAAIGQAAGKAIEARYARLAEDVGKEIKTAREGGKPEDQIFTNPYEQALWSIPLMPEADRVLRIAALRSMRPPATPNSNTSPPPIELAG